MVTSDADSRHGSSKPSIFTQGEWDAWQNKNAGRPSAPEAAEILKVSRQYVLRLMREGRLPAPRVARDYGIVTSALGPHLPAKVLLADPEPDGSRHG